MESQKTIKEVLTPLFEVEFPPSKVFVLCKGKVKSVTKQFLDTIDNTFVYVEHSAAYNIPFIEEK